MLASWVKFRNVLRLQAFSPYYAKAHIAILRDAGKIYRLTESDI